MVVSGPDHSREIALYFHLSSPFDQPGFAEVLKLALRTFDAVEHAVEAIGMRYCSALGARCR
jgi:hypothetical protein